MTMTWSHPDSRRTSTRRPLAGSVTVAGVPHPGLIVVVVVSVLDAVSGLVTAWLVVA